MSKLSKKITETIVHKGKIVETVQFPSPDGKRVYEKARRAPGVRLIIPDGQHIILTREYRQEIDSYDFRLPGGKVFDTLEDYNNFLDSGEDIIGPATKKAIGEGAEEAGIITDDVTLFHTSKLGTTMEWDLFYFVVDVFTRGEQSLEQGEDIELVRVLRDEAKAMCLDGRIDEERSALTLLRYLSAQA